MPTLLTARQAEQAQEAAPAEAEAPTGPQPPADFAAAWAPAGDDPFDAGRAGHLLRRATFGAKPGQLQQAIAAGPAPSVDALFAFDPKADTGGLNAFLQQAKGLYDIRRGVHLVAEWWYHRMTATPFPIQERMALFWHGHFATSAAKVGRSDWMHDQIELFRTDGLGSFRDLLIKVGRQPAMLRWLDGHASHKSNPNENYAREIMELFCLGVATPQTPNYTEADIDQLARCFSGWLINGSEGRFDQARWDETEKTIFAGQPYASTGPFNDEQAVDAILKHPEAPRFIAKRLLQEFVHPEPREEHIAHYAQRLLDHQWVVGEVLKEMFKSKLFYSDWAYRSRIKSPVELAIGSCYMTGATPRASYLRTQCERMGQMLLYPPNVAGWSGGEVWINANTVMVRFEFFRDLAQSGFNEFADNSLYQYLEANNLKTADAIVNAYSDLMLDGEVPGGLRGRLLDYMTRGRDNKPAAFVFNGQFINEKVKGMLQLMSSAPQFQLA